MRRIVPIAALALAGCQTAQPQIEIREVPVPVACVDPADIPEEPPTVSHRFNGDARHDLEVLAPSARAVRQWGQDLRALLDACTGDAPAENAAEDPSGGETVTIEG